jgi:hypothetical protein
VGADAGADAGAGAGVNGVGGGEDAASASAAEPEPRGLDRGTAGRSGCSVLWSRERSSRALSLSGADGVPEYGLEEGEVGRYREGEVCE